MNLSSVDQTLQLIAWFLALAEFILALYVLLLNVWHTANRHVSTLLLLFAINNFALGLMMGATDATQAALPTYLLAATTPIVGPGLLLVTVVLLKPHWLRSKWRGGWWLIYGLGLLPILLVLVDAWLGTRLWYTGPDAETYVGGFVPLTEFTVGSLSLPIRVLNLYALTVVTTIPMLHVALRDKEATPLTRRLAWLLLGAQIVAIAIQLGLSGLVGIATATLITNSVFVLAYAYAGFRQMVSERRLQRGRLQTRLTGLILVITVPVLVAVVAFVSARAGALIEQVAVQQQEAELQSALRQFQRVSWTALAVGVVMLLASAWLAIRQAFQPIGTLTETVAAIAAGDLTRTALVESEDEIGSLARAFNGMTEQLCNLISGLEQRARDLSVSEKRFRDIAESSADWIWEVDAAGRYTYCSESVVDVLGYTPEEVLGQTPFEFMPPDEAARVGEVFAGIAANKQPIVDLENRSLTKDGRKVVLLTNGVSMFDREGNFIGYRGVDKDITERVRAEEEIKRRGEELEALQEISLAITAQLELDELLQNVVEQGCRLLDVRAGGVYLVDEERGDLELVVSHGYTRDYTSTRLAPGEGICGKVLQSGAPLAVDDYCHWEGRSSDWEAEPLTAALGMPLKHGGQVIGALNFAEIAQAKSFDEHDVWLATLFANQAAIAIENARLYEGQQRRLHDLLLLHEISTGVNTSLDPQKVLKHIVRGAVEAVGADAASINLLIASGEAQMVASVGLSERFQQRTGVRSAGTTMAVIRTGEPLLIPDVTQEPDLVKPIVLEEGIQSFIVLPLPGREQVIGAMFVIYHQRHRFSDDEVRLLTTLANHAAIALENARLFEAAQHELAERKWAEEKAQRRAAQAALIYEVGRRVSGKLELEALLSEIVTAVRDAFDYYGVMLLLLDEEAERLTLQSIAGGYADSFPEDLWIAIGEGMIGHAAATGETQISGDVSKNPRYVRKAEEITRSELTVPIKSGHMVIGVLDLQSGQFDAFDETDVMVMETLADQVAVAIENARLYEEARRRAQELEVINEVGRAITSVLDLSTVLRQIVDVAKVRFGHYFVGILLVEGDRSLFRSGSTVGDSDVRGTGWVSIDLTSGPSLIAEAARTGQPVLANDTLSDPRYLAAQELPDTRSELCLPIKAKGRVIGVLDVQSDRPSAYGQADVALLQSLADQAGVAIENASLFEQARTRARELAVLNELAQALTARLNVEQVLEEAYQGISRLLEATDFYVALYDPDKDEVTFALDVTEGNMLKFFATRQAGEGLTGYIIRNQTPLLIRENLPERLEEMGIEPIGRMALSWLGVPLMISNRVLGVMAVQSYTTPRAYDEHDRDLLTAIASQAAIAIQNARLYEQAQRELTERKRAEEALRQEKGLLDTLMTSATDSIYFKDTQSRFTRISKAHAKLFGLSDPAQAVGKTDFDFFTEEHAQPAYEDEQEVMRSGQPIVKEEKETWPDGRETWVSTTKLPLRDEEGKIIGTFGISRDITERKRAEKEAQRRVAQAALIYEVGRRVSGKLELEPLLSEIVTAVRDAFDYYEVLLMLLDEETERLILQSVAGAYADFFPQDLWMAIGEGMTGHAAATGETQISDDVSKNPHYVRKAGERTKSELAVPIRSGHKVIGVLDLQSNELDAFDETDVLLMETLADQIAVAIENARLYEQAQQRLREQAMLFNASQRLAGAPLQAEEIADIAVRQLAGVMEATECSFSLLDPQKGTLKVVADFWSDEGIEHWEERGASYTLSDYPATARVMETLEPMVVQASDPHADPAELAYMEENEAATLAVIPLAVKGQVIGVMELETWEERHYTPEQFNIAMTLANQAAVALENARLYEAAQRELAERKRAEEALRQEKELLDALMTSAADSIYFKDRRCRLTRINRKMMQGLNLGDASQVIGKTDVELFGEEFGRKTMANELQIMATGEPLIDVVEGWRRPDGQINWTSSTKVPLRDAWGQIVGIIGITREINERKRAEEQLQRYAAELEQANEEVKRFAYIVSHDLRAPLVNMKGFASELRLALDEVQSAMDTVLPHLDEKQRQALTYALREDAPEALDFIDSSVTRMDHFINALLKLSRLGRRELKLEPVDTGAVVQAILPTLAHQLAEHEAQVSVEPLPPVVVDRTSMEQIMGNILDNAIKYLDPDRPGEIEISAECSDDETIFHVRDNGRGIAEGDMDKVFAPFRRAGKQDVPGEGMGLAYVQTLMRRHGGRIWVESEPGKGSTFHFTIPANVKCKA